MPLGFDLTLILVFVSETYAEPKYPEVQMVHDPTRQNKLVTLNDDKTTYTHAYAIMRLEGKNAQVEYYESSDENSPLFVESVE